MTYMFLSLRQLEGIVLELMTQGTYRCITDDVVPVAASAQFCRVPVCMPKIHLTMSLMPV